MTTNIYKYNYIFPQHLYSIIIVTKCITCHVCTHDEITVKKTSFHILLFMTAMAHEDIKRILDVWFGKEFDVFKTKCR